MDRETELVSAIPKTRASGLSDTLVRALQLALCAPALAYALCRGSLLVVTLALVGAALISAGLTILVGARLGKNAGFYLTLGIYALFALIFVWIYGSAAAGFTALGLAALCVLALAAVNARIALYQGAGWMRICARILAALVLAFAVMALGVKL